MFIACVAFAITAQDAKIDADRAGKLGVSYARALGIAEPLALRTLEQRPTSPWGFYFPTYWEVDLARPDGRVIDVQLSPTGRLLRYSQVPAAEGQPWADQENPDAEKIGASFLNRLPHSDARVSHCGEGQGVRVVSFDLLVHGHRFFNVNPTYGYSLYFSGSWKEVSMALAIDQPPPVNALKSKISEAAALARHTQYASEHQGSDGVARMLTLRFPPKHEILPELGFYKLKSEATARLVWRGNVGFWADDRDNGSFQYVPPGNRTVEHGRMRVNSGPLAAFVDAQTGDLVTPDDR